MAEEDSTSLERKPYFCKECKRTHTKGKIYKEHLPYALFEETADEFDEEEELIAAFEELDSEVIKDTVFVDSDEKIIRNYKDDENLMEEYENDLKKCISAVKKLPGVGEATLNKLIEAGFSSLEAIAFTPPHILMDEVGLGDKTTYKLTHSALDMLGIKKERSAFEIWNERASVNRLTTSSPELDDCLHSSARRDAQWGLEPGTLTELFGEFRTGKTQLCHQLCVNVQLPFKDGGLEGNAYYIDTNNTFRPERIAQMAEALDLDRDKTLKRIIVSRAYNSDQQIDLMRKAESIIRAHGIKLLVIDNLTNFFITEYPGRGQLQMLRSLLRSHLNHLHFLTDVFPDLIIVYVNQVETKPDVFYGNPIIALGDEILAHAATTRIFLRKGKGEQRLAKIIKSPYLPESEAVFSITEKGISE